MFYIPTLVKKFAEYNWSKIKFSYRQSSGSMLKENELLEDSANVFRMFGMELIIILY